MPILTHNCETKGARFRIGGKDECPDCQKIKPTKDKSSMPEHTWLQYNHGLGYLIQNLWDNQANTATINAQLDEVIDELKVHTKHHARDDNSIIYRVIAKLKEMRGQNDK